MAHINDDFDMNIFSVGNDKGANEILQIQMRNWVSTRPDLLKRALSKLQDELRRDGKSNIIVTQGDVYKLSVRACILFLLSTCRDHITSSDDMPETHRDNDTKARHILAHTLSDACLQIARCALHLARNETTVPRIDIHDSTAAIGSTPEGKGAGIVFTSEGRIFVENALVMVLDKMHTMGSLSPVHIYDPSDNVIQRFALNEPVPNAAPGPVYATHHPPRVDTA